MAPGYYDSYQNDWYYHRYYSRNSWAKHRKAKRHDQRPYVVCANCQEWCYCFKKGDAFKACGQAWPSVEAAEGAGSPPDFAQHPEFSVDVNVSDFAAGQCVDNVAYLVCTNWVRITVGTKGTVLSASPDGDVVIQWDNGDEGPVNKRDLAKLRVMETVMTIHVVCTDPLALEVSNMSGDVIELDDVDPEKSFLDLRQRVRDQVGYSTSFLLPDGRKLGDADRYTPLKDLLAFTDVAAPVEEHLV